MKFDFCIGNPPYQADGSNQKYYPMFYSSSKEIADFVDMIFPTAWQEPKNTNGLQLLNNEETKEDKQIISINNVHNAFTGISGAEWTNIVLWKKGYDNKLDGKQKIIEDDGSIKIKKLLYNTDDIEKPSEIKKMYELVKKAPNFKSMKSAMSVAKPYGLRTDIADNTDKYGLPKMTIEKQNDSDLRCICKKNRQFNLIDVFFNFLC